MTEGKEKLLEKWRRFKMRSPEDRRLILRATLILPMTEIGLRLFGFRRWKELIEKFSISTHLSRALPVSAQNESTVRTVRAVRSAELHGLTKPNCLERSMTLWWMLRSEGIEGELHIGARKQGKKFEAHAWVELGGQVLNDYVEVHQHYARFDAPNAATEAASQVAARTKQR
jgi:Transglutaminase-like superfamily